MQDLAQRPELMTEFEQLLEKLQSGVHYPSPRTESRLLPLLPESTVFYVAVPNYGDAAQQALTIFRNELRQSAALREWWQHGEVGNNGPKVERALETFRRLSQYLGDEIVMSASVDRSAPSVLLIAPVTKPGLKAALQETVNDLGVQAKSRSNIRILDAQELAVTPDTDSAQDAVVLVRPDYVVAAGNIAALRRFNARLEGGNRDFLATGFGRRIARAYQDNVSVVGAVDLQTILGQALPEGRQERSALQGTGFADAQYMVWEHANVGGQSMSQSELSFVGPRRGIASWLGPPTQLGSLDFASPNAVMALSFVLANPAQIFDDLRELATSTNPRAFDAITQSERSMKVSFQQDLLRQLGGEVTIELDSISEAGAVWKAILRVNDAAHLQRTLTTLLAQSNLKPEPVPGPGVTYYKVSVPTGRTPTEYGYAFVDGYLVIGSSAEAVKQAVRLHRSGTSLAKSQKFLKSLPAGHASGVSALMYQDQAAMTALQMKRIAPDMAGPLAQMTAKGFTPAVMAAYAEENAIRSASTSTTMDVGVVAVMAAIAVPNLLRSRTAANEASAVGSLRTLNTAQVVYASTYSERGFATDLESLGPGSGDGPTAEHAGLVDASLGCSGDGWCEKSGYRFRMSAVCIQQQCPQYVAVATPVDTSTGSRNFCSTSDGVIRIKVGPPLTGPIRPGECKTWEPLR